MRCFAILTICALSLSGLSASELPGPGVRLLQGTLITGKTVDLDFLGDEQDLGDAALPVQGVENRRVTAKEIMADLGPQLRAQALVYAQAQLAAGTRPAEILPLHVILDPEGSWAYAHSITRFRYRQNGRWIGPLTCPALVMGMRTDYAKPQRTENEGTAERNEEMLALLGPWFASTIASKHDGRQDLEKALKRWTLTMDDGSKRNVVEATAHASSQSYLGWLQQIVVAELDGRKVDGKKLDGQALWDACPHRARLEELVIENQLSGVRTRLAETVSHEMGHLIHFTATGPRNVNLGGYAPHMKGTSHQLTTLSNEEFAFVEGWAEANAAVVMKNPEQPDAANRIDYTNTADVLRTKLNEAFARATGTALHRRGYLAPSTPFTTPPWDSDRKTFMAGIRKGAMDLGMTERDFDRLVNDTSADEELAYLLRADSYVQALQARKGERKARYDYLRSERSVAHVLAQLRLRLGAEVNGQVLETLARKQSRGGKPDTLAELLESFVHQHPEHRLEIYAFLAEITEGILVTFEEAALVAEQAQEGMDLEIDLDRDGWVPGGAAANALLLHPASFPAEAPPMEGQSDPLNFAGKRNENLVPMTAAIPLEERSMGETPMADQQLGVEPFGTSPDQPPLLAPADEGYGTAPREVDGDASRDASGTPVDEEAPLWDDLNAR